MPRSSKIAPLLWSRRNEEVGWCLLCGTTALRLYLGFKGRERPLSWVKGHGITFKRWLRNMNCDEGKGERTGTVCSNLHAPRYARRLSFLPMNPIVATCPPIMS